MTQFTPGPWRFRKEHGLSGFVEAPKANGMAYGLDVCGDDYTGYGGEEQREINMHLIAAAPDMYEALKAFVEDWTELGGKVRGSTLDAIDAAMLAARGSK